MTYDQCSIPYGWQNDATLSHRDDLAISSGWLVANAVCHPDNTPCHCMSSRWVAWGWYLTRMTYGQCSISSGWHTTPPYVIWMSWLGLISHPDDLRHFYYAIRMTYAPTLTSSWWDSRFKIFTTHGEPSALPNESIMCFAKWIWIDR